MTRKIAGRYELLELIGQGGMADVYLAKDTILNRALAVKILRTSLAKDPLYVARFKREASAAASLSHKNVVEIYDVGEDNNEYFIAMEYVTGVTLKELIHKRGALHFIEAINIFKQAVAGVKAAHRLDIIHRDLKPQNILVTDSGIAKIADFGIASMESLAQVTKTDVIMGSLHYLAPELCRGEKATVQSDIYALGIVLYELLRGDVPFSSDTPVNIALKHMQEEIPAIREFNPTIPQSIENIITKATAKNLADRYHSTDELLVDLEGCIANPDQPKITFAMADHDDQATIIAPAHHAPSEKTPRVHMAQDHKPEGGLKSFLHAPWSRKKKIIVGAVVGALVLIVVAILMLLNQGPTTYLMPDLSGKTVEEAREIIESYGGSVAVDYEYQLTDDIDEGLIVATDPLANQTVSASDEVVFTLSSGKYIIVGDYVGMDIDDVTAILAENELPYLIEEVIDTEDAGQVVDQSLEQGTKVDPNGTDVLTLSVSKGWSQKVPNMISINVEEAKTELQNLGFTVVLKTLSGDDLTNAQIDAIVVDEVVSQSIEPNTIVSEQGTSITLEYYDVKPNKKDEYEVTVSNYLGGDVFEARNDLLDLGFVVNLVALDPSSLTETEANSIEINTVISQSLPQNTVVTTRGTKITLTYYDHLPQYE
ncbi:MAG: Stk1 family PASTA domain-containing Ser/Thr kinase [Erysipelotrichaceae bacterium]|nr:Stk1 family PASTA domain-containing Ser/Thr kinase [Erysipelotrichaceae bacterium]